MQRVLVIYCGLCYVQEEGVQEGAPVDRASIVIDCPPSDGVYRLRLIPGTELF